MANWYRWDRAYTHEDGVRIGSRTWRMTDRETGLYLGLVERKIVDGTVAHEAIVWRGKQRESLGYFDHWTKAKKALVSAWTGIRLHESCRPMDAGVLAQVAEGEGCACEYCKTHSNEPSGLLRDTDFFRQLQTGDALACGDKQVYRIEPSEERDAR